jgi:serine/threonine protein kinase
MPLTTGSRLGPYEVIEPLGAGGMGEVYRARDTTLDRDVAIKILPESLAQDPERLSRFAREAKTLAALNHPNIAIIHGFEQTQSVQALVMEMVPGPTLAERIADGRIPLDEALPIARQMAEALEAAHGQGIIHRDLKPANVKLRPDGTVKVLDFGLAKVELPTDVSSKVSRSPTITSPMTQAGLILGTAAYMAPEQARGKPVDTRADVWAFGVVLFEMLAGRRPFDGDDISDALASILKSEPAWQALPAELPPPIGRLLRRCLQKDRRERLQHIGDARLEIEDALRGTPGAADATVASRSNRFSWASALAGVVAAGAVAAAMVAGRRAPAASDLPEMRLEISTPQGSPSQFAISPDGRMIAFSTIDHQRRQLWVRALDETAPRALAGTEGSEYPFWSPDSRSIGFFANNKLKRVELDGGPPQLLANVLTPAGGTWNAGGTILYVPNDSAGVMAVSAQGGEPVSVTPPRQPALATRLPQFLPDGRHFLFYVARGGEPAGVYVGELGRDSIRRLVTADRPAVFGADHLWFVRERDLFAQRFDPSTLAFSGPIGRVAENVGLGLVVANLSAAFDGPIAYRAGSEATPSRRGLVWFDRSGKPLGTVGEEGGFGSNPSLSADSRYVVLQRTVQENIDVWMIDLQRNVSTRLTDEPGIDSLPVWSPDGSRIAFSRATGEGNGIVVLRIDRAGPAEMLVLSSPPDGSEKTTGPKIACDWSPDGSLLMFKQVDGKVGTTDLWVVPLASPDKAAPIVATPADERDGQFSPDGRWIAYESDESGTSQIYVQPFPGPGLKVRVSTGGGSQARWRRDGKELFYIAPDDQLMAVSFDPAGRSDMGTPTPLFKTSIAPIRTISRQQYVVSPDGQRFLVVTTDQSPLTPVTLLLNWKGVRNP